MTVKEKIDVTCELLRRKISELELEIIVPSVYKKAKQSRELQLKQYRSCLKFLTKVSNNVFALGCLEFLCGGRK